MVKISRARIPLDYRQLWEKVDARSGPSFDVRVKSALSRSLEFLSRRNYSRHEMRAKLGRDGYEAEDIEAAITHLEEMRYMNDAELARQVCRQYHRKGNRYLIGKMRHKGIAEEDYQEAIVELPDETQRALAEAEKRLPRIKAENTHQAVEKLARFLANRGYSPNVCWQTAKEVGRSSELNS